MGCFRSLGAQLCCCSCWAGGAKHWCWAPMGHAELLLMVLSSSWWCCWTSSWCLEFLLVFLLILSYSFSWAFSWFWCFCWGFSWFCWWCWALVPSSREWCWAPPGGAAKRFFWCLSLSWCSFSPLLTLFSDVCLGFAGGAEHPWFVVPSFFMVSDLFLGVLGYLVLVLLLRFVLILLVVLSSHGWCWTLVVSAELHLSVVAECFFGVWAFPRFYCLSCLGLLAELCLGFGIFVDLFWFCCRGSVLDVQSGCWWWAQGAGVFVGVELCVLVLSWVCFLVSVLMLHQHPQLSTSTQFSTNTEPNTHTTSTLSSAPAKPGISEERGAGMEQPVLFCTEQWDTTDDEPSYLTFAAVWCNKLP